MKCIKIITITGKAAASNEPRYLRVSDGEAEIEVRAGRASYAPKSEWKKATRPALSVVK